MFRDHARVHDHGKEQLRSRLSGRVASRGFRYPAWGAGGGVSNAALPVAVAGCGGVSNVARPVVVPRASGRATLLLPDGRSNNVARPDAVPARPGRVTAAVQRFTRQPLPELVSAIMFPVVITEDRPGQNSGDVP